MSDLSKGIVLAVVNDMKQVALVILVVIAVAVLSFVAGHAIGRSKVAPGPAMAIPVNSLVLPDYTGVLRLADVPMGWEIKRFGDKWFLVRPEK